MAGAEYLVEAAVRMVKEAVRIDVEVDTDSSASRMASAVHTASSWIAAIAGKVIGFHMGWEGLRIAAGGRQSADELCPGGR